MVNICAVFGQITGAACPLCRRPGPGFCEACRRSLPYNRHACPRCALPLPDSAPPGIDCADCQRQPPAFDRALAPLLYRDPVDTLVSGLKYQGLLHLGPLLAGVCVESIAAASGGVGLLLPVPMHADGLRERGFNQATELTRWLSRELDIPWAGDRLLKIAGGRHQQTLKRGQRRRNVRGTFACTGRLPPAVALVDDVMTTGATAAEASRVLKQAGAQRVEVWAIARTPRE